MEIFESFYALKNEEKAVKMAKYMKNKFPFLGIATPERNKASKEFLKQKKKEASIDWDFINQCYGMPEREFHYLAIDYLAKTTKFLVPEDTPRIQHLIVTNSWWDSVDGLDGIVGDMCLKYPELKDSVISSWVESENIWLKRVAIDFQLHYKEKTDTDFLKKSILHNSQTKEFFINKAIGWSLREYSKTNPAWVRQFLNEYTLSKLSVREASKYITLDYKE